MKKMILSALMLVAATCGYAQVTTEAAASSIAPVIPSAASAASSSERSAGLPLFSAVVIDGAVDITFIQVPTTEVPSIVYDTKGSYTTKFQAEVRDNTLFIREKVDTRRPERTTVTVRYNTLLSVNITDAVVKFAQKLASPMLDLTVGARSSLVANVEVTDLDMSLSGESSATLSGSVRYLTLAASTGRVDLLGMECISAQINAQSKADVRLNVFERLVAKVTTGATIHYKGNPSIVRTAAKFFAGDIKHLE